MVDPRRALQVYATGVLSLALMNDDVLDDFVRTNVASKLISVLRDGVLRTDDVAYSNDDVAYPNDDVEHPPKPAPPPTHTRTHTPGGAGGNGRLKVLRGADS